MVAVIKIYKYPLELTGTQNVVLPFATNILTAQVQNGVICLWAVGDQDDERKVSRVIRIVGTGHRFDDADRCHYIGTVQIDSFVWHIFENPFLLTQLDKQ